MTESLELCSNYSTSISSSNTSFIESQSAHPNNIVLEQETDAAVSLSMFPFVPPEGYCENARSWLKPVEYPGYKPSGEYR
ncbi:hypothetical protein KIN20_028452 [Parelaphostrongylus tenuis]|uniref:Uncharacterized protein n=1 Tax=Parelaphostrongylus tenuis TaxID=148309 RepID=A0AAD5WET1_PARTN|nr:hypothetical protein KIN20_028443 [Parelaphostrongylus tenuis]KAJ1367521.1 hypothetical protein KIN20_028452 [Parelaphostrongylus tenuis]